MSEPGREHSDRDVLHRFGYAQQLLRDMGGFSNFAISFSVISVLTGGVTLYGVGLNAGGPVVMGIGWPLVTLFVLLVAAAMAELASAIPTSGALYHWACLLGGAGWGWITAWLNLLGLIAAVAGIDYGCAQFVVPLLGLADTSANHFLVFTCLLFTHAVLNHAGIRIVARLNDFSAVYHVAGVLVLVAALALFAPKQPVAFLFTERFSSTPQLPYWFAFLGGLLQAQWTYTGYDASAHTIEETRNARVRAPWGMYLSVAVSGLFGFLMLALVTLAIGDVATAAAAANPFIHILEQALGTAWGRAVLWMVTLAMWFCGLSCVTSTSRMIFAFARDGGMPCSQALARISPRHRSPALAVWLAAALSLLLPLLILGLTAAFPQHLEFAKLYPAVTGISTIGLYLSYGIPLWLKQRAIRRGVWTHRADGPWTLGSWSRAVNRIALVWIAFISVLFVLPPNHLTGYIFAGVLALLAVYYRARIRGRFHGPTPHVHSNQELLRIERELEGP